MNGRKLGRAAAPPPVDGDDDDDPQRTRGGRTRGATKGIIGKAVEVRVGGGETFLGTVKKVVTNQHDGSETWQVENSLTGATSSHKSKWCTVGNENMQTTPLGLRPRDLGGFIAGRGNHLFEPNLTCSKKYGPTMSGTPIAVLHATEAGFTGYGTMGDVMISELAVVFSKYPVHSSDPDIPDIATGDLLFLPNSAPVPVKITKSSAKGAVTSEISSQCFVVWGDVHPASEAKDALVEGLQRDCARQVGTAGQGGAASIPQAEQGQPEPEPKPKLEPEPEPPKALRQMTRTRKACAVV